MRRGIGTRWRQGPARQWPAFQAVRGDIVKTHHRALCILLLESGHKGTVLEQGERRNVGLQIVGPGPGQLAVRSAAEGHDLRSLGCEQQGAVGGDRQGTKLLRPGDRLDLLALGE